MIQMYRQAALAFLTITVSGCGAKPVVEDNSPLVRAVVIESEVSSSGVKGLFGHVGTYTSSTTSGIQRRDDTFKFSGSVLSRIGGKQDRSNIVSLDEGVEWSMDNKKRNYSECPLDGCKTDFDSFLSGVYDEEREGDFEDEDEQDVSCVITDLQNTFDVGKTGQSRAINGFSAEEYLIDWRVSVTDNEGKKAENVVEITLWTTPETPLIAEALRVQEEFDKKYAAARVETYPVNVQKAIPSEVIDLFTKFLLNSFSEEEVRELKNLMAGAGSIEGYPVSRKVKWDARDETCAAPQEPEEEQSAGLDTSSFSGLLKSVGRQVLKQGVDAKVDEKKREIALAPIMLFVEDVKSIEIGDIRESRLSVPEKYKLINRK